MNKITQPFLLVVTLLITTSTTAANFNGYAFSAIDQYVDDISYSGADNDSQNVIIGGSYQPRTTSGLTAFSAHADASYYAEGKTVHAVASLALYGSDSNRLGLLPPNAGVEPMVDVQLSASARTFTGYYYGDPQDGREIDAVPSAVVEGNISVLHRVILNSALPDSVNVADLLNNIPLSLQWAYDFSGYGNLYGEFIMAVDSPTGDCANGVGGLCGFFAANTDSALPANSGNIPFTAVASTDAREALYDVQLYVYGTIRSDFLSSGLQGVIDPYLMVDQSWQYASYFTVQQESTLNPGEWVAITRDYLNPVPIPPTAWLFGSGLFGLIGIARRKKS